MNSKEAKETKHGGKYALALFPIRRGEPFFFKTGEKAARAAPENGIGGEKTVRAFARFNQGASSFYQTFYKNSAAPLHLRENRVNITIIVF